jgi:cold shock CspA family protein/ribosome-associated translation inhibitor RaiA
MQTPLRVAFDGVTPSPELEEEIRSHADALEQFHDRITSCRVTVSRPHRHRRAGVHYALTVDVRVPQGEIVVSRGNEPNEDAKDPHVLIRDAFHAARRQLEDHARRIRGDVKQHEGALEGRVARLFAAEDHGFLETPGGESLYFHRHSLLEGDFDRLQVGTRVRFQREEGRDGPNARSVRVV